MQIVFFPLTDKTGEGKSFLTFLDFMCTKSDITLSQRCSRKKASILFFFKMEESRVFIDKSTKFFA